MVFQDIGWAELPSFLILTFGPAVISFISARANKAKLFRKRATKQPFLAPPAWVFPVAWTTLYLLMGFASFLIYKSGGGPGVKESNRVALFCYVGQYAVCQTWSPVFFGKGDMAGGLWIIGALWSAVVVTVGSFYAVSGTAAALLLPYLAWVSFASYLNYATVHLNGPQYDAKAQ